MPFFDPDAATPAQAPASLPDRDPLTAAVVSVAWLVVFNKPFYPLYVWGLVGAESARTSLVTLIAMPLYAALPFASRKAPFAARAALPVIGALDTLLTWATFSRASGGALFLIPCLMLASLSFRTDEVWTTRAEIAFVFVAFLAAVYGLGTPLEPVGDAARLLSLNLFSAASLSAFIGLRWASVPRT